MLFQPILIVLLLILLGLLALSMGYRQEKSAVGEGRQIIRILKRMARRNPDRYGPALALHMRMVAIELLESGRPAQALLSVMTSVDIYRAFRHVDTRRLDLELEDALELEHSIKTAMGYDHDTDLGQLAEEEELEGTGRKPARETSAPGRDGETSGDNRDSALFWWLALYIWFLSAISLGISYFLDFANR